MLKSTKTDLSGGLGQISESTLIQRRLRRLPVEEHRTPTPTNIKIDQKEYKRKKVLKKVLQKAMIGGYLSEGFSKIPQSALNKCLSLIRICFKTCACFPANSSRVIYFNRAAWSKRTRWNASILLESYRPSKMFVWGNASMQNCLQFYNFGRYKAFSQPAQENRPNHT